MNKNELNYLSLSQLDRKMIGTSLSPAEVEDLLAALRPMAQQALADARRSKIETASRTQKNEDTIGDA